MIGQNWALQRPKIVRSKLNSANQKKVENQKKLGQFRVNWYLKFGPFCALKTNSRDDVSKGLIDNRKPKTDMGGNSVRKYAYR